MTVFNANFILDKVNLSEDGDTLRHCSQRILQEASYLRHKAEQLEYVAETLMGDRVNEGN